MLMQFDADVLGPRRHSLIHYPPCSRQEGEPELQQAILNVGLRSMDLCSWTGDSLAPMPFGSSRLFWTSGWKCIVNVSRSKSGWRSLKQGRRYSSFSWILLSFARTIPTMCRGKTKFFFPWTVMHSVCEFLTRTWGYNFELLNSCLYLSPVLVVISCQKRNSVYMMTKHSSWRRRYVN